ncbi:site-specific integrase [Catenovulum agarivorans]|uniref:site-specific integrase n=1 Tax=Catenovulum agarivorans TaxID=1172192 RepID=UPI00030D0C03|nr:site-specific integrase [Catenovulum agarivorans]
MNNLPKLTGIKANKSSIAIEFTYNNIRCRETIKCKPTKTIMQELARKREAIIYEISLGKFDYAAHFPNSKKAKSLTINQANHLTVEELLSSWFARKRKYCAFSTIRGYKTIVYSNILPKLGKLKLSEIKPSLIKDWVAELQQTLSPKRINNILTPLKDAFRQAYEDEIIDTDPMARVKNLKLSKADINPFTLGEIDQLLKNISSQADRNMIEFAFFTGLRTSEYMALTWDDVNLNDRTVAVNKAFVYKKLKTTKTKAGIRTIELCDRAYNILREQKALNLGVKNLVFPDMLNNDYWYDTSAIRKRIWIPAIKQANLTYRNPYQTRHTFASQMLSQGKNPLWVAQQMGHEDWGMIIKTYGKWIKND